MAVAALSEELYLAQINYYAVNKHYRHIQTAAKEGLKKLGNEPKMHFWDAVSMLLDDRVPEAMRDLQNLVSERDVTLGGSLALIHAHKLSSVVDKEAVGALETRVKTEVKSCGEAALLQAGLFLWHTGKFERARDIADKLIKMNANSASGHALRGWVDLTSGRDSYAKKSIKFFDQALTITEGKGPQALDALMGKIKYVQMIQGNYADSIDLLNQAVVAYPMFLPALIEKARAHMAVGDWDQAVDTAKRCLAMDDVCILALRIQAIFILARTGNSQEATRIMGHIIQALDQTEPKSHFLYYETARVLARLSNRHPLVLQQTRTMLDRAMSMAPTQADYITELGYQLVLGEEEREAMKTYKKAMSIDETSVQALNGIIYCQILENQLDEAGQQLEFLNEIQSSLGKTAQLSFLSAALAAKKQGGLEQIVALLDEATTSHLGALEGMRLSEEYFTKLDPDFLIAVGKLYLQCGPTEAPKAGDAASPVLVKCARALEGVAKGAPGVLEGVYLLARTKYLGGDIEAARSGAQFCLKQDNTYADAHLLMARINLYQGNTKAAAQSLEIGLSYNFEVRESPAYHLIQAKIQQAEKRLEDSAKTLLQAMKLPGVKRAAPVVQGQKKRTKRAITLGDRVSIYLELVDVYWKLGQQHEATKVMQDALNEFEGTSEESRVQIANANMSVQRGDVEGALMLLRSIGPTDSYYIQAKEKTAEIYLNDRKDKRLYAACYREMVDQNPTGHTCLLLGDAYMNIQEPDKAIAVYESALKKNPRDGALARKIGEALVKTHDFSKAINYYEAAVKSGSQPMLRADLAELYIKLRQFDKADKVLSTALEQPDDGDLDTLTSKVKFQVLMAKKEKMADQPGQAIEMLSKARETQARVISRVSTEQPEGLKQQQQTAAEICMQIAAQHEESRDVASAVQFYQEAIRNDESNTQAMLALAKLHLAHGDMEAAQMQLSTLLRTEKQNNDATVMMADLMFRKQEYESATFHFQQLLEREPDHYEALCKLVDLLRRAGKLVSCPKFLDQAAKASARPDTEPGLNYCRGLYHRYVGEPNKALKAFNLARHDSDWGVRALYNMIEICLNPENETIGGETFERSTSTDAEAVAMGLKTAEKLLQELGTTMGQAGSTRFLILANYARMATKNKANIEQALNEMLAICAKDENNVAALLGMARAYMLLRQQPKARNQLKRVTKMAWTSKEAEEFEGAWLLLSDIYIGSGKYDLAQELLKKCLQHNKSCSKAWEYMGYIFEKENSYVNAAEFYENAAAISAGPINPQIGYKLSFNLLKARKHVEAIDVALSVLKAHPTYPKIEKDVLQRARAMIRM